MDNVSDEQTVTINLRDFMYIYRVLEEYVRFFHQSLHYPTIEDVNEFLGMLSSGGGYEVLSTAFYEKMYKMELPKEIEEMIAESMFEHPLFPEYYHIGDE